MGSQKRKAVELEEEFEVEKILAHRAGKTEVHYLIKWAGTEETSWESRSDIVEGTDVLASYWANALDQSEDPAELSSKFYLELGPWHKSLIVKLVNGTGELEDVDEKYEFITMDKSLVPSSAKQIFFALHRNVLDIEMKLERPLAKTIKRRQTNNSRRQEMSSSPAGEKDKFTKALSSGKKAKKTPAGGLKDVGNINDDDEKSEAETAFPCKFRGCVKRFKTNKGQLDHVRYHRVYFCKESPCKWKGPSKRFNRHLTEKHSAIVGKKARNEARERAGLKQIK